MRHTSIVIILSVVASALFAQTSSGVSIAEIQGAGHQSAMKRESVEGVRGVVTAVAPGHGFYMESPVRDNDPATSEGIFVSGRRLPRVSTGDLVVVKGRVEEVFPGGPTSGNLPITTLGRAEVEVLASNQSLPNPVLVGDGGLTVPGERIAEQTGETVYENRFDPVLNALDLYESLEGMRVQINNAVSVGTVHTTYGEIWVLPDFGSTASVRTARGGIVVREGDFNPERMLVDYLETPSIFEQDPVRLPVVGDTFEGPIVGIMSYSFGNYKLRPVGQLPRIQRANLPRERVESAADDGILSVAAFNVWNLNPNDDPAKFADLADTIADALASPDIVVLSEIQDGDGTRNTELVSSAGTAEILLQAISRAGTPGNYQYVDIAPERNRDGGAPGGNIRVGFLYRSDRVDLVVRPGGDAVTAAQVRNENGSAALYPSPARVDPTNRAFSGSRKPLVAEFRFNGTPLYVIGNHLNSKGGDGYIFGQVQPPSFNSETRRTLQAETIAGFVDEIMAVDRDAYIIVAGDLNDFAFSRALDILEGDSLVNLASLIPEADVYSYIYEGNSQALDHILVSRSLLETSQPTVQYVHRYAEYLYEERHSDHDPVLARFRLD